MAMTNSVFHRAKREKNDEFYTPIDLIEREVPYYKKQFEGKWVYSPCDDYRWSKFVEYFRNHFEEMGLKHYTATCYDIGEGAWRYDYDGKEEKIQKLQGDGDFQSEECTKIKDECDIVCTNPPFSKMRLFYQWLKNS